MEACISTQEGRGWCNGSKFDICSVFFKTVFNDNCNGVLCLGLLIEKNYSNDYSARIYKKIFFLIIIITATISCDLWSIGTGTFCTGLSWTRPLDLLLLIILVIIVMILIVIFEITKIIPLEALVELLLLVIFKKDYFTFCSCSSPKKTILPCVPRHLRNQQPSDSLLSCSGVCTSASSDDQRG